MKKIQKFGKKPMALALSLLLLMAVLTACAGKTSESTAAADADSSAAVWDTSVPTALTDEVRQLLESAASKDSSTEYTPVAVLGVSDGTYCVLCKGTDSSGAAPKNILVYVNAEGIQNTYEIWIEKHGTSGK